MTNDSFVSKQPIRTRCLGTNQRPTNYPQLSINWFRLKYSTRNQWNQCFMSKCWNQWKVTNHNPQCCTCWEPLCSRCALRNKHGPRPRFLSDNTTPPKNHNIPSIVNGYHTIFLRGSRAGEVHPPSKSGFPVNRGFRWPLPPPAEPIFTLLHDNMKKCLFIGAGSIAIIYTAPLYESMSEPTETSKQPIRTRYLDHVTGYQPIRDYTHKVQYTQGSVCCITVVIRHNCHSSTRHSNVSTNQRPTNYPQLSINWFRLKYSTALVTLVTKYSFTTLVTLVTNHNPQCCTCWEPLCSRCALRNKHGHRPRFLSDNTTPPKNHNIPSIVNGYHTIFLRGSRAGEVHPPSKSGFPVNRGFRWPLPPPAEPIFTLLHDNMTPCLFIGAFIIAIIYTAPLYESMSLDSRNRPKQVNNQSELVI
eukprot:sb/3465100/